MENKFVETITIYESDFENYSEYTSIIREYLKNGWWLDYENHHKPCYAILHKDHRYDDSRTDK